jgi:hypothetical protein
MARKEANQRKSKEMVNPKTPPNTLNVSSPLGRIYHVSSLNHQEKTKKRLNPTPPPPKKNKLSLTLSMQALPLR